MNNTRLALIKQYGFEEKNGEKIERLGWLKIIPFSLIENKLNEFEKLVNGYDNFVFSAMGGSINTIKTLKIINNAENIYTIDSLDPKAMAKLKDLKNPIMIAISKSGTTLETKTLAERWGGKVIWMKDDGGDLSIQFDGKRDIGGRFSSPNTMIFWAPLFLIKNKNIEILKKIYKNFEEKRGEIEEKMWLIGQEMGTRKVEYFHLECHEALETWMIQLFEESLGSKIEDYNPKTIAGRENLEGFTSVKLSDDPMKAMYEAQILVASLAVALRIVFVNQPMVEMYKKLMADSTKSVMVEDVEAKKFDYKFVEVVGYWNFNKIERKEIRRKYEEKYLGKIVFVFEGSDWNHHSLQAAYGNKETLFIILTKKVDIILDKIARATYETLKDKALFEVLT